MDNKGKIKKLIACSIPLTACNLQCHYCYITQLNNWEKNKTACVLEPEKIAKALSLKRLGGPCIVNLTGKGETLIPKEMPEVIKKLLEQGHYLEVVTNGTLTNRFEEIAKFPKELLSRLEFKFSFHYLELKKHNWMEVFFENVKRMRNAGCSITVELMPNDELVPFVDDIKRVCMENVGAFCHLTIGRNDVDGMRILTDMPIDEYLKIWNDFDSEMFRFKYSVFNVKRKEFCYAGMWTLYVDLATGAARQCYGFKAHQNIYNDEPLYFRAVGHRCKEAFCYNAHAYMSLGVIPEIKTPTYADIRDRVDTEGNHWLTKEQINAFSCKLADTNDKVEGWKRVQYYLSTPLYLFRILVTNKDKVRKKIFRV